MYYEHNAQKLFNYCRAFGCADCAIKRDGSCPTSIAEDSEEFANAIRIVDREIATAMLNDSIDHGDMDKAGYYADRVKQLGGIADSGDRTEFSTGAVRDMHSGKGRMDLLPWAAIMELSKHCENGAMKYGEHNVDKGIPLHSLIDSGMRHLAKFADGWTDEPHLLAAAWNILWAVQMTIKHPELVDVPWRREG